MLCLFVGSGVLVHEILRYIIHPSSVLVGVVLSLALVLVELSRVGCLTLCFAVNLRTGIRLRTGVLMLGFNKILSLRGHRGQVGQIVDVLTSDSLRLFDAVLLCPLMLPFPLLFVFCSVYSVYILGYTALIGFFIILLFIVLQCVFATLISCLQKKSLIITDSRVQSVNELLSFIKLIKMFVWETSFTDRITDLRRSEVNVLQRSALIQNLSVTISPLVPVMAAVFTFIVHTSLGLPLTTHTAYPIVTIFNCMRFILSMTPSAVKLLAETAASVGRLKKLLLIKNPESYISRKTDCRSAVVMEKATLSWNKPVQHPDTEDRPDSVSNCRHTEVTPTLKNISFTLNKVSSVHRLHLRRT
ncbi:multidrug resistance-associated protein 9-like [Larimichthys crocea]|uniref:multidrug resistance-associated protein 9-like n=1 Tax=Larimichthys crocea TaxID=215358 RepID=UPI000F5FC9FB|nr:multidrug resistance-associated protein 9-like [Larimichthys crocea]